MKQQIKDHIRNMYKDFDITYLTKIVEDKLQEKEKTSEMLDKAIENKLGDNLINELLFDHAYIDMELSCIAILIVEATKELNNRV